MRLVKWHCNVYLPSVRTFGHIFGSQHHLRFRPWADKAELVTLKQYKVSECCLWLTVLTPQHNKSCRSLRCGNFTSKNERWTLGIAGKGAAFWQRGVKDGEVLIYLSQHSWNYRCSSHSWLAHMIKLLSTTSQIAVKRLNIRRIADPVLLMTESSVTALIEGTACEAVWLLWSCPLAHNATRSGIDQPIKWVLEFSRGKQNLSLSLGYFNGSIWSRATTAAAACASVRCGLTCLEQAGERLPPRLRRTLINAACGCQPV